MVGCPSCRAVCTGARCGFDFDLLQLDFQWNDPILVNGITLLDRAYQFQPSLQDTTGNAGLFALSVTYAYHSKQAPYLFFEYLIRIRAPVSLRFRGSSVEFKGRRGILEILQPRYIIQVCTRSGSELDRYLWKCCGLSPGLGGWE